MPTVRARRTTRCWPYRRGRCVVAVVDDDDRTSVAVAPRPAEQLFAARVVGPARRCTHRPGATTDGMRSVDEAEMEPPQFVVVRFDRASPQEHGHVDGPTLELPFVPERRAGQGGGDHGRRPPPRSRQLARDTGLVVVLREPQQTLLILDVGREVVANPTGVVMDQ